METVNFNKFKYKSFNLCFNKLEWKSCRYLSCCDWIQIKKLWIGNKIKIQKAMKSEMKDKFIYLNQYGEKST